MALKTLGERVVDLEYEVGVLRGLLETLLSGVVFVEKSKPGPVLGSVWKRKKSGGKRIRIKRDAKISDTSAGG